PLPPPAPLPTWCHAELREVPLLAAPSNPDPLHAIDEPAARAPACTHSSPSVRTCQHVDAVEATRCSVWQCEAWLLVNCWQLRARCQRQTRGRPPRKAVLATSSCCARLKAMPRSRFRILACLRRYFSDGRGGSSGAANPRSAPCPGARAGPSAACLRSCCRWDTPFPADWRRPAPPPMALCPTPPQQPAPLGSPGAAVAVGVQCELQESVGDFLALPPQGVQ